MWSPFSSTMNYLGGKRRLVPEIFKHVPHSSKAPVFADAFLGGGSVSLFAKAKGYTVLCNDLAERSCIIGRALIENDHYKITDEDILRLLQPATNSGFIEEHYTPKVFTKRTAKFLDNAFAQISTFPVVKQDLLRLMLMRFMVGVRPFGHFSATAGTLALEKGEYEKAFKNKTVASELTRQITNPYHYLQGVAKKINTGVFDNGNPNKVYHGDVFDFVKQIKADVIYFDPPYADTSSYEEMYCVIDCILTGVMKKPDVSDFTKKDALAFQDKLYAQSWHIKHWVISMGQTSTASGISLEELLAVVRKYRPKAEGNLLKHAWTINNGVNGKKQAENVEYLIFA